MSNGRLNQVLLVGEASARLEVDFVPYGLACVGVGSATEAVARMKGAPFALVVVSAGLPDMTGPAFVEGLLRHFDPSSVVLVGDVDAQQAAQLQRSPRVAVFPSNADGAAIADHLFQRVNGGLTSPPTSAPTSPPTSPPTAPTMGAPTPAATFPGPGSGRGLFEAPRTGAGVPPPLAPVGANPWPSTATPRPAQNGAGGSTLPFLAAFGAAQAQQQSQPPASLPPTMASYPPPSAGPDRATLERIEAMATELAQANAEVVTLRARLGAAEAAQREGAERLVAAEQRAARAEAEAAQMRGEIDAARRSAINQVAEVMALSDEGEPITAELDDLKSKVDMAEAERDSASSQLSMVRDERDRLTKELVDARQQFQERALELDNLRRQLLESHADVEQARAAAETAEHLVRDLEARANAGADASAAYAAAQAELDAVRALLAEKDFESARALEEQARALRAQLEQAAAAAVDAARAAADADKEAALAALRAELEATHAADVDALVEVRTHAGIQGATRAAVEAEKKATEGLLLQMKSELDALRAEKADIEVAWAADQQRAAELETRLGEEQAARLDVENGLRADLNEALKQLNTEMQNGALESARAERSVADAAALRTMLEGLTHEQSRLMGEMESLRPIAAEVEKARATVVDLQRQLEAALGTDEKDGDATRAIDEAVKAQTRSLLELARAIEPFTWGLQRAAAFFADKNIDGSVDHLRALNLLEKTLERMKSELDKVHTN